MFHFIPTIFNKLISIITSAIIAVGIVHVPPILNTPLQVKKISSPSVLGEQTTSTDPQIENLKKEIEELKKRQKAAANQNLQPDTIVAPSNSQIPSPPPNTTFCNGKNWSNCPVGQKFYCPPTGDAQCTIQNSTQNNAPTKSTALQEIEQKISGLNKDLKYTEQKLQENGNAYFIGCDSGQSVLGVETCKQVAYFNIQTYSRQKTELLKKIDEYEQLRLQIMAQ